MNFKITSKQIISKYFTDQNIFDFYQASKFVRNLPYKRNINKNFKACVFEDSGGTCSTKHALLKELAIENNQEELKLMLGIFNMNSQNTAKISKILEKYNLTEIPEAHNYLKVGENYLDFTRKNSKPEDFLQNLVQEIQILPNQILEFKADYHKKYLKHYLEQHAEISLTLTEFWQIREECIVELQT
jgi:hypothetical protein